MVKVQIPYIHKETVALWEITSVFQEISKKPCHYCYLVDVHIPIFIFIFIFRALRICHLWQIMTGLRIGVILLLNFLDLMLPKNLFYNVCVTY